MRTAEDNQRVGAGPRDVVFSIAWMKTGGAQTHLLQVFRFLDRNRYRPHLFCLRHEGNLIESARALDVPVSTFGIRGAVASPGEIVGLARMRAALAKLAPQIVHAYLLRANFAAAVAARLSGVPVVLTSKRGLHAPAGTAERLAVRISNTLSDRVVANSDHLAAFTRAVEPAFRAPLEMIANGIDVDRFDPALVDESAPEKVRAEASIPDGPVVGSVMTFRPRKGFRMLFEAFARVKARLPTASLVIVGEAPMPEEPAALAAELGITDSIFLLGRRDDMPEVLSAIDVFTLASTGEGMSNAMLEAMAMRRPPVITAIGGAPMVVDEGRSGWLVEPGDVELLAERLAVALENPGLREEAGRRCRERIVSGYSAGIMVGRMMALYDEVCGEKGL